MSGNVSDRLGSILSMAENVASISEKNSNCSKRQELFKNISKSFNS